MPVEFKDYYRVLGVSPKATVAEIKKAFRTLARKYHPDVAKDKKSAEEKFKELNEAHEVLSSPESRQQYDELGAHWKTGPAPRSPPGRAGSRSADHAAGRQEPEFEFEGTGFSEFFEQFFGGRARGSRGASPFDDPGRFDATEPSEGPAGSGRRGPDIHGDILITLDEALSGALRTISVRRTNGRTGLEDLATFPVRIPPGVRAGQSIRVKGKGGEGTDSGSAGDLYLRVRYAQHPDWQARGPDLVGHLDLAPWEAVLGATIPVRTLEDTVSLRIPAGTQQGHQLRIRGKGLPGGASRRGDLYVGVVIQVPPRVGKDEERLWKQLSAASSFQPRRTG